MTPRAIFEGLGAVAIILLFAGLYLAQFLHLDTLGHVLSLLGFGAGCGAGAVYVIVREQEKQR